MKRFKHKIILALASLLFMPRLAPAQNNGITLDDPNKVLKNPHNDYNIFTIFYRKELG